MALGMWSGFREAQVEGAKNRRQNKADELEEARYQQGRDDRAEELNLSTMTSLRGQLLPEVLKNFADQREYRTTTNANIKLAQNAGLSKAEAMYIVGSGQWTNYNALLEKHGTVAEALTMDIQTQLDKYEPDMTPEEKVEKLTNVLQLLPPNPNDGDARAASLAAIYGTKTPDQLLEYVSSFAESQFYRPVMLSALQVNFNKGKTVSDATTRAAAINTKTDLVQMFDSQASIDQLTGAVIYSDQYLGERTATNLPGYDKGDATAILAATRSVMARLATDTSDMNYSSNVVQKTVREMLGAKVSTEIILRYLQTGIQTNYKGVIKQAPWQAVLGTAIEGQDGIKRYPANFEYNFSGSDYKEVSRSITYAPGIE